MVTEKTNVLPWMIGGGVLLIGGYLFYSSWQRAQAAAVYRESWKIEAEAINVYLEQITAGGREPTAAEWDRYERMLDDMALKERVIEELSRNELTTLAFLAEGLAKRWYLVPLAVIFPVAGYIGIQLFRDWFRQRCVRCKTPTCEKDGLTFSTEADLAAHIAAEHQATEVAADIVAAQAQFNRTPYWVRETIAAESELYYKAHQDWRELSYAEIMAVSYSIMVIITIGALAAAFVPGLAAASVLLLL